MFRRQFLIVSAALTAGLLALGLAWSGAFWILAALAAPIGIGLFDSLQRRRAVLRNWPLIGRLRYLLEAIRPEIQQYFIESDTNGSPFSREVRSLAYQRAKGTRDTIPFGTLLDVYEVGYEWMNHSLGARSAPAVAPRVHVGGPDCARPYASSLLNISAMSYGALSHRAVLALNAGAADGGFAHNTGEGGISPYHLKSGADLVWQIGTGYFGCRTKGGNFCPDTFREQATLPEVRMIEVKLSQGAKPGHGGILPASKLTPEIAAIRDVPLGHDVISPPTHSSFATPRELLQFLVRLRELSGGKPVGFKLCVGDRVEFLGICKAMLETGVSPDFITVDGGEGGTGAAPVEFTDAVGSPLREGLAFVHSALTGVGRRDRVRVVASGKIITGFDMVRVLASGADICNSARGMMFALGCIQARRCNSNDCPVGVATQRDALVRGLDIEDKARRVARFHQETVRSLLELVAAAGLDAPDGIRPHHVWRRVDATRVRHYGEIHDFLEPGALLAADLPERWKTEWAAADPDCFPGLVRHAAFRGACAAAQEPAASA